MVVGQTLASQRQEMGRMEQINCLFFLTTCSGSIWLLWRSPTSNQLCFLKGLWPAWLCAIWYWLSPSMTHFSFPLIFALLEQILPPVSSLLHPFTFWYSIRDVAMGRDSYHVPRKTLKKVKNKYLQESISLARTWTDTLCLLGASTANISQAERMAKSPFCPLRNLK